ncbi:DUF1015 domain-containing protein [Romboutsia weinsteinii]|uniref:DUF1015 domain-containing protein n=1 Tax=Romboutsia weinsteinii TaxID=2020949 RepID=A0A371IYX5_9FIRM|nr:DUF1015 family protein [Romboutsia weinsteinii]RDY25679.1 DUF1015 domain-containing protein [Romboutsia weinsteinii]
MAIIRPFKAIRPKESLVDKVASLPYDVMNTKEAREIVNSNMYSFLRIDKAEVELDKNIHEYDEEVYVKARENLKQFIENNILIRESKECLYIYREIMDSRPQVGIVACVSVDDTMNNIIKKHEYTKPDKELDRTNYIKYCNANTGTILLTYKNKEEIDTFISKYINVNESIYDFMTDDKIQHTVWRISEDDDIEYLVSRFKMIDYLYIADGHHRSAAAVNIAKKLRKENPNYIGDEEFNYYLAMIAPAENLLVLDYNRVVRDLNNLTEEELIRKISERFKISKMDGKEEYRPSREGIFGMYLNNQWYEVEINNDVKNNIDPVKTLDISILQEYILSPILGIDNPRIDKRIDFVGGIRGIKELERRTNEDMKIAFAMYPTSMEDLIKVANEGRIMPAKSTWFEPKVRCGLFIHELDI